MVTGHLGQPPLLYQEKGSPREPFFIYALFCPPLGQR